MKKKKINWVSVLTIIFTVIVFSISIYIMVNRIGQVEGVQCGPGQYYYTDIPNWRQYFLKDYYNSPTPMYVLIFLFFAWGILMYKLWCWLD